MGYRKKREKMKKKAPNKKKQNKRKNFPIDVSGPVYTELPNPFQNISRQERMKLIDEIGTRSNTKLEESLEELDRIIRGYNPIHLLSVISNYGLSVGVGPDGVHSDKNQLGILQSDVEFLQAKLLQIDNQELKHIPVNPETIQKTIELIKEIRQNFSFSRFKSNSFTLNESERSINKIQEHIRGNTQIVRNWGYRSQIINFSKELYSHFDDLLLAKNGYTATNIIDIFIVMQELLEERLSTRFKTVKELFLIKDIKKLIFSYYALIGLPEEDAEKYYEQINYQKIKRKQIQLMLLSHFDLFLTELFMFDTGIFTDKLGLSQDLIEKIFNELSYSFGELKDFKPDSIYLDNPIWEKPLIKIDSQYFCPIPQLFFSFIIPIMDGFVEKHSKKTLELRKAKYLENKIEEIVKRRFPTSQTISSLKWNLDNKIYETNLITFIDSHAIIIEAKSHKITKPALRGAPERIKKHIEQIIIDPANQSWRLEQKLKRIIEKEESDDDFLKQIPVNLSDIFKIVRVSVSLEDFASLQTNLKRIDKTGWFPKDFHPCPSMNLSSFETLFDFLDHPIQIIHYLMRRQEIESELNIEGDEIDFIGSYKDTLFNFEFSPKDVPGMMSIYGMSADIDHYYDSIERGVDIAKPKIKVSTLFNQVFNKLEERSSHRWTEMGCILNRFSPASQFKLERLMNDHIKIVNKSWQHEGHKNIIISIPPLNSEYAIAIVLIKDSNANKKKQFINYAAVSALEKEHVKKCLVIVKNIDHPNEAYNFIGLLE